MVAYNFKAIWAPSILTGLKRQTIRARGERRHVRTGESFDLYIGQRTKHSRKLGTAIAEKVQLAVIEFDEVQVKIEDGRSPILQTIYHRADLDDFARADGFKDWDRFHEFFQKAHGPTSSFNCVMIGWRDFQPEVSYRETAMSYADRIIQRFGGRSALARLLGHKNSSTVQGWHVRGIIPPHQNQNLLDAAFKLSIKLDLDDLFEDNDRREGGRS